MTKDIRRIAGPDGRRDPGHLLAKADTMSLRAKIVFLLTTLIVVYVAAGQAIQREFVLPRFDEIERTAATTDMARLEEALGREQSMLQMLAADWGNWAEMYRMMAVPDPRFIAENTAPESMKGPNLNLLAFVHPDGRYAFHRGYAARGAGDLDFAAFAGDRLPDTHPWRRAIRDGRMAHGMMMTEHGPLLLAIGPILDGSGRGPARGAVLMGRLLSPAELVRLSEQARVDARMLLPGELASAIGPRHGAKAAIVARPQTNDVYLPLRGIDGREILALAISVPRRISAQGREAVRVAGWSLVVSGVLTLLVELALLGGLVLRPLDRITRHAVAAGRGNDLTARIGLRRGDELGVLAAEFDRMMDRLLQARMEMADATYRAGVAEMAGGVLHNVGNALTPIGARAGALRQRLCAVPLAELRLALAELRGDVDPARRADLEAFVIMVARELARVADEVEVTTDAIGDQVNAIHGLLSAQSSASRSADVVESVALGAVVEQALALVPADRRDRVVVSLARSVTDTGSVRIPRITAVQAFQNVIQNACEAMPAGRRGALVVRAATHAAADDGAELHVEFADDGDGIAPDHLARVFTKGFSTKPGTRNSGVGLHWTANALNAIGGRIELKSPGPGRGATAIVVLPRLPDPTRRMENAA